MEPDQGGGGGGVHHSILSATERLEGIKNDESNDQRQRLRIIGAWNFNVEHFVDFLLGGSRKKELFLEGFSLSQPSDGGLDILLDFLATDTNLTKAELCHCDFGTKEDASRLLATLRTNKSVTNLRTSGIANLKDATLGACLSGILQHNGRLQKLDCTDLCLSQASQSLQPGLRSNRSLKELCLFNCDIGDAGIRLITDSLMGNTTLAILDIGWNEISPNGLNDIMRLLESTQLKKIMVGGNHGILENKNAVECFIRVLQHNASLEEFSGFYPDQIPGSKRAAIEKVLARNQFMNTADSLLALQPGTGMPIGSKKGLWSKAIAKMGQYRRGNHTGLQSAIFKMLRTRPTTFEKQLVVVQRPTAAALTHPDNESSQRRGHNDASEKDADNEEGARVGVGRKRQRLS